MEDSGKELREHWAGVVRDLFSAEALIDHRRQNFADRVAIRWPLKDDPTRPNKASRQIVLVFSDDTCEDYRDSSERERSRGDERLRRFVQWKLKAFDPKHDTPRGIDPPYEEWHVTTALLNGRAEPVFD